MKKKWTINFADSGKKSFAKLGWGFQNEFPWYENIWWQIEKIWNWPFERKDDLKYFIQRGLRGYSDRDAWGIDWYLSEWMPKAIRQLRKNTHGYPDNPFHKNKKMNIKVWKNILEEIALGFEAHKKLKDWNISIRSKKRIKLHKDFDKGMKLFHKWYFNLWD